MRDVALRVIAGAAVRAVAAADGGGHHHAIARPQIAHVLPDLLDHPDRLVPENRARLHPRERAADEVQIRTAYRARRDPDQRVARLLDLRLAHILNADITASISDDGFHLTRFLATS